MLKTIFKFRHILFRSIHIPKDSTIVSGVQPTGKFHIGNLFGVFDQWAKLQTDGSCVLYFIADLHAITNYQDPNNLRNNILEAIATLIACGISYENVIIFQQSQVREHAELAWILGCMTTLAKLDYLPAWKQRDSNKTIQSLGLYAYPVLQAADILLYRATHVPIGQDQLWHLHLTQHLVQKFNQRYHQQYFPTPQPLLSRITRLKSLKDPGKKMSKSDPNDKSRINLVDSPEEIRLKIRKALTHTTNEAIIIHRQNSSEPQPSHADEVEQLGVDNLKDIYRALSAENYETSSQPSVEFASLKDFKEALSEMLINRLNPIRESIINLREQPQFLQSVLKDGSEKARAIASQTLIDIKKMIGL